MSIITTEHHSEIHVREEDGPYVCVWSYADPEDNDADQTCLSLTPKEARRLADNLLTASQRAEDRLPGYNE